MAPWQVCLAMVLAAGQKHIAPHLSKKQLCCYFLLTLTHIASFPMSRVKYESPSFCPQHLPCAAQGRQPQAHRAASPSSLLQPVTASCYTQSGRNKLTYFGWLAGLNKQLLLKGSWSFRQQS